MEHSQLSDGQVTESSTHDQFDGGSSSKNVSMDPNLSNYQLIRDRERRTSRPPSRYDQAGNVLDQNAFTAYALTCDETNLCSEPNKFSEAVESEDSALWLTAMEEEMASLYKNGTWELTSITM